MKKLITTIAAGIFFSACQKNKRIIQRELMISLVQKIVSSVASKYILPLFNVAWSQKLKLIFFVV